MAVGSNNDIGVLSYKTLTLLGMLSSQEGWGAHISERIPLNMVSFKHVFLVLVLPQNTHRCTQLQGIAPISITGKKWGVKLELFWAKKKSGNFLLKQFSPQTSLFGEIWFCSVTNKVRWKRVSISRLAMYPLSPVPYPTPPMPFFFFSLYSIPPLTYHRLELYQSAGN